MTSTLIIIVSAGVVNIRLQLLDACLMPLTLRRFYFGFIHIFQN